MKKQSKSILKFIIIFCLIIVCGCEKDSYEDTAKTVSKSNFTVKEVSLSKLSNDEKLLETVKKIKPGKKSAQSKIIYDPLNNFYFDDTSGKEIITEAGYKSYTFQIISDDNTYIVENVLFTQKENGEYDAYRVQYDFTEEQLKNYDKRRYSITKSKLYSYNIQQTRYF